MVRDAQIAAAAVKRILDHIEPNPNRSGIAETPKRVVDALTFMTEGYHKDPAEVLKTFEDGAEAYDEMVFQGSIPLYSTCEHHILPFFGIAHIGYIPQTRIVGLSKLARLLEIFARRLQVQERLTSQVADALASHLSPDVGVVLRCRHMCMEQRGVQKPGTITYTSALRGSLKEHRDARDEFMKFVSLADTRMPHV